ncbi:MAG: TIGR02266 family protein, partial [Myxococcales bacterium]|nr:TIGR02266 family protein [Myxococcales bacterium]
VVDLTVELPGGFEVQAAGIVRWVSVADDEDDVMPGMGVELLGIDGTAAEMIRAFIASRPPRFHA